VRYGLSYGGEAGMTRLAPFGLTLITPPPAEPVSLDEAKKHLRVDISEDDGLIAGQVSAAREWCETNTGRSFLTQTWRLTLDVFPGGHASIWWGGWSDWAQGGPIRLPRAAPLQSVGGIQYTDGGGGTQTLAPTEYQVVPDREPAVIVPQWAKVWPVTRLQPAAVTVTYTAGWTDASLVPAGIKAALKLVLGWLYRDREPGLADLKAVQMLLAPYDTGEYI
jgi:uncharacterized phiE125 gp8 family phage protein